MTIECVEELRIKDPIQVICKLGLLGDRKALREYREVTQARLKASSRENWSSHLCCHSTNIWGIR
jgi:hypothetical protein